MLGLVSIKTLLCSDDILKRFFVKILFIKKSQETTKFMHVSLVLSNFINLTQVHNFTVSAQAILPSVDFRYLP